MNKLILLFPRFHQTSFFRFCPCISLMPLPFLHPSTILIAGPSGCGKTYFLINALCNDMLSPKPDRVVLVYGEDQPAYRKLEQKYPHLELIKGPLPKSLYEKFNSDENNLLILDDQMLDASNSTDLGRLFVQGSIQKNLTVIFLVQNIFEKEPKLIEPKLFSSLGSMYPIEAPGYSTLIINI